MRCGFTLLELSLVIALIGLLAGVHVGEVRVELAGAVARVQARPWTGRYHAP